MNTHSHHIRLYSVHLPTDLHCETYPRSCQCNCSCLLLSADFNISLTASRTQQLCDAMTVSKDLMANLLLAAGGRGSISTGGGGGSTPSNWGKDDDEDEREKARRCAQHANWLCKPIRKYKGPHR